MLKAKKRRLVVAVALLLLSAVLMSTTSYAWFALNTKTTADNFQVEAYTDSRFLQISKTNADAAYTTAIDYTSAGITDLRLTTTGVINSGYVYKGSFTEVTSDTYYDGATVYYQKALSDIGATLSTTAYNYNKVDLTAADCPTDLTTLYTDITFVEQVGVATDTTKAYTYFVREKNDFNVYTGTVNTGDSLKDIEVYLMYQNGVAVTNGQPTAPGAYTTGTYYEEESEGVYAAATLAAGDSVVGYYNITFASAAGETGDGATVYFKLAEGKYTKQTPKGELDNTYYVMQQGGTTVTEPVAEVFNYVTGDTKQYWAKDGSGNFSLAEDLSLGTNVKGYYTATLTQVEVNDTAFFDGSVYYKLSASNDYECIGAPAAPVETDNSDATYIKGYRYWGRSYSESVSDAMIDSTLNILPSDDAENGEYYLKNTFYIRQAEATNHATNLRVSKVSVTGAKNSLDQALRVLLIARSTSGETAVFSYDAANAADIPYDDGVLFAKLLGDEAEVITVDMYIYFDGTDTVAKNENLGYLNGKIVSVEFAIDDWDYNAIS